MRAERSKLIGYALLSWPPHAVAYVAFPLLVSRADKRRGWRGNRPGPLNLLGLPFLAAGAGLIAWAIRSHYQASPAGVQAKARPDYLVTSGAYGLTRNPLYLGGAAMWAGWAALLGSRRVVGVGTALFGGLDRFGLPFEERMLTDKFGDTYRDYRDRVPRWLREGRLNRGD